jgi:hypothetical protein
MIQQTTAPLQAVEQQDLFFLHVVVFADSFNMSNLTTFSTLNVWSPQTFSLLVICFFTVRTWWICLHLVYVIFSLFLLVESLHLCLLLGIKHLLKKLPALFPHVSSIFSALVPAKHLPILQEIYWLNLLTLIMKKSYSFFRHGYQYFLHNSVI